MLQLVPAVGGLISELLGNVPKRREQRMVAFVQTLAGAIQGLGDELDENYVRTDGFGDLFEDVMEKTRSRREVDRMEYYAARSRARRVANVQATQIASG